jgi:hypothetical protein
MNVRLDDEGLEKDGQKRGKARCPALRAFAVGMMASAHRARMTPDCYFIACALVIAK